MLDVHIIHLRNMLNSMGYGIQINQAKEYQRIRKVLESSIWTLRKSKKHLRRNNMKLKELQKKIDNAQNEYHQILMGLSNEEYNITEENGRYHWEHIKVLQKRIINLTSLEREISLNDTKERLESAFTPKLKDLLKQSIENENEE